PEAAQLGFVEPGEARELLHETFEGTVPALEGGDLGSQLALPEHGDDSRRRIAPHRGGAGRFARVRRRSGLRGALRSDDLHQQVREDVLVQTDGRLVLAERADRGHELDGATIDVLVEDRLDALGDLLGGDSTEETAVLAGALGDDDGLGLEGRLERLRLLQAGDRALAAGRTDLVELTLTALGPRGRETAGQEEVTGVAVLDVDDVTGGAEARDLVGEDELGGHVFAFLAQRPEVE